MRPLPALVCALAAVSLFSFRPAHASGRLTADDYLNLLRIDLRAAKSKLVTEAMELSVAEARAFLPIYQKYDKTLSKLNAGRITQLRGFMSDYANIDDVRARELSRETFTFMRKRLELLEKTTRRIEKATSPRVAARFAQIENQLLMLVDVQLASDLPLVPRESVAAQ